MKKPRPVSWIAPFFNPIVFGVAIGSNNVGWAAFALGLFWLTWRDRPFTLLKQKGE